MRDGLLSPDIGQEGRRIDCLGPEWLHDMAIEMQSEVAAHGFGDGPEKAHRLRSGTGEAIGKEDAVLQGVDYPDFNDPARTDVGNRAFDQVVNSQLGRDLVGPLLRFAVKARRGPGDHAKS